MIGTILGLLFRCSRAAATLDTDDIFFCSDRRRDGHVDLDVAMAVTLKRDAGTVGRDGRVSVERRLPRQPANIFPIRVHLKKAHRPLQDFGDMYEIYFCAVGRPARLNGAEQRVRQPYTISSVGVGDEYMKPAKFVILLCDVKDLRPIR